MGINQLGAVYEGLLSYGGFFAQERLYEVKKAGASPTDESEQSYFVPESELAKYNDDEFVCEEVHGTEKPERRRKKYEKGTFVFRLAGRDRQKSASYYTPECLTQCVVKYALKELLKDRKADEIARMLGLAMLCEISRRARENEMIGRNPARDQTRVRDRHVAYRQIDPFLDQVNLAVAHAHADTFPARL